MLFRDWGTVALLVGAVVTVMTAVNTAAWFVLRAVFVSRTDMTDALDRLAAELTRAREARIGEAEARLDARVGAMASADELGEVKLSIARVEGTVGALAGKIDGLAAVIARLENPLNLLVQHHLSED